MTILCDNDLHRMCCAGLITPYLPSMVNPASIDIRVGDTYADERTMWKPHDIPPEGLVFGPGAFALVATHEVFQVPNGYALDLRLKSSSARRGWNHSLAFWVDPGWIGKLTMEISNVLPKGELVLRPGTRFAQVIVHELSGPSAKPYAGRYQHATAVEGAKN